MIASLPFIAAVFRSDTLNISPKVGVPGAVGLTSAAIYCNVHHYFPGIDAGAVFTGVIVAMIFLGVITPQNNSAAREAIATVQNGNKNGT